MRHADIARAGIFVSIDSDVPLRVERGFVRPEDEAPVEPIGFDPADIARAGIFVSIDSDGALRVERGSVLPEYEAPVEPVRTDADDAPEPASTEIPVQRAVITIGGAPAAAETETPE